MWLPGWESNVFDWDGSSEQGVCVGIGRGHTPLLIEELSCKLLSSHMHETCCTNQLILLLMGQHTNFTDAEPAVAPPTDL